MALAFAWTSGWHAERGAHRASLELPAWRWWAAGTAIGCLPWFSTKYLVMAAVLGLEGPASGREAEIEGRHRRGADHLSSAS